MPRASVSGHPAAETRIGKSLGRVYGSVNLLPNRQQTEISICRVGSGGKEEEDLKNRTLVVTEADRPPTSVLSGVSGLTPPGATGGGKGRARPRPPPPTPSAVPRLPAAEPAGARRPAQAPPTPPPRPRPSALAAGRRPAPPSHVTTPPSARAPIGSWVRAGGV